MLLHQEITALREEMKNILCMAGLVCLCLPHQAGAKDIEHIIRCESSDFTSEQCRLPIAPRNAEIKEIRLVRQLSSKPCVEGKTWEGNYDGITVTNGCRAEFRVVYQTRNDDDRYDRHHRYRSDDNRYEDEGRWDSGPSFGREEPADIVIRVFQETLNRAPSRKELQEYQYLLVERNWTERDIRKDLQRRGSAQRGY
jgi:hypothetical protein